MGFFDGFSRCPEADSEGLQKRDSAVIPGFKNPVFQAA
jgi:hypothetical protein